MRHHRSQRITTRCLTEGLSQVVKAWHHATVAGTVRPALTVYAAALGRSDTQQHTIASEVLLCLSQQCIGYLRLKLAVLLPSSKQLLAGKDRWHSACDFDQITDVH